MQCSTVSTPVTVNCPLATPSSMTAQKIWSCRRRNSLIRARCASGRLRGFLQQKGVARQYWPERVEVLHELPRTATGKIRKSEIRDRFGGTA